MPTASGQETIGERLTRLRSELARVRAVIDRSERNGTSFTVNGQSVSQIAYDRAIVRAQQLETQIGSLEARLAGTKYQGGGIANTRTVVYDYTQDIPPSGLGAI